MDPVCSAAVRLGKRLFRCRERVPRREVIVVGVCGASGSGKSTLSKYLAEELLCPLEVLGSDMWFKWASLPPCPHGYTGKCPEIPESQDLLMLCEALSSVVYQLATADNGEVPDIVVNTPMEKHVFLSKTGEQLSDNPVHVIVEGFVIFAESSLVSLCHHLLWLETDCNISCQRRWSRKKRGKASLISFQDVYTNHIFKAHEQCRERMLANLKHRAYTVLDANLDECMVRKNALAALGVQSLSVP